ncbi:CDP-diacylglycerol--glycerol-3-phosphate 3-phosphatidyltransferase [Bifidobacterium psychraerophilum]|jgi:CDP-diacylglycerol--glycerol-3-phosphate 3-phosphatidyltransferase|uniref:CDP-diacylglycerol--glycerol-3-phosphate 3-phosphatidyltransferase n=1 Tax=Bifidobacterium psychraerophilum TaxID=218140 RepID=UPI0023F1C6FB|nr:CDP-diacylglycerol--glycerol-3-phosphate 3-phosphatidyltransferase [Bifidobacterium psychraerophilum]MCI1659815.1 CDP-diacylglycerol--glycerol-3-phosphate 3-phosphatidyltransferase [Bifidobacterium psychraerophilum]MCI1804185.1 CDP-diacylglycerol--glycerol-3-phosphate 3-phosphatidyltransferase [Bifidobacterium psychraerophilum]MCI2176632.1 CDP-diacylglycerol--glycerol-3-phosphate 3-phosphatidyltransferase [Bifidobacterium psychraerophilum]MCI2181557.1 CDP-diacylglycerol--glycerol-3-phosphate
MEQHSESESRQTKGHLFAGWNSPPNLVTYARIVLVVVFIILDVRAGTMGIADTTMRWWAFGLFVFAASTDKLDGWMARRFDQVTELGKLMDPIADKLLICSALVVASVLDELSWWITALFLIRELGITVMRFVVIDTGGKVIAASQAGKFKTLAQCVGIAMLLAPVWSLTSLSTQVVSGYQTLTLVVMLVALFLCLYSGAEYLVNTFAGRRGRNGDVTDVERKDKDGVAK